VEDDEYGAEEFKTGNQKEDKNDYGVEEFK
jgi:hypothetical protein